MTDLDRDYALPEEGRSDEDPDYHLPEYAQESRGADVPVGTIVGFTQPEWVLRDGNSHDPDVQIPIPDDRFTDY